MEMTDIVFRAMMYAHEMHASIDHRRKYTNDMYIMHPAHVAGIVASIPGHTPAMVAAAWLHDVAEDVLIPGGMTRDEAIAEIRRLFGDEVARIVDGLTDVSKKTDGNRKVRKAMDRAHTAAADWDVQSVKCADLCSNTMSIVTHDKEFAKVYLKEKEDLLKVMTKADPCMYQLAMDTLTQAQRDLMFL